MRRQNKVLLIILVSTFLFAPLGMFSRVYSQPVAHNIETMSLDFLTHVYPLNFSHYNIILNHVQTLDSDPIPTQSVGYFLNSPDSNLAAGFLFKDGTLYSASLSVINGSATTTRAYDNLTDMARDFLMKYQAFSGADSTDLIQLLDNFDETKNTPVTLGNNTLSVSHLKIPNQESVTTTFKWIFMSNDFNETSVSLTFGNTIFGGFFDSRQLPPQVVEMQ